METIISIFLTILGIYILAGLIFGLYFLFFGATRIDPLMANSRWIVRLLLFPGLIAVWPFLVNKLRRPKQNST